MQAPRTDPSLQVEEGQEHDLVQAQQALGGGERAGGVRGEGTGTLWRPDRCPGPF